MAENTLYDQQDYQKSFLSSLNEKLISRIHKEVKKQNSTTGLWSAEENLIYAQFIEDHPFEFETAEKRRRYKVFERMAIQLPNRTAIQCRSHNQKMVKLAGHILNVPRYIKRRIQPCGKKISDLIHASEEENSGQNGKLLDKSALTKNLMEENETSKQHVTERRFELPLKLCIEIRSENIEQY